MDSRVKFASQADPDVLANVRAMAVKEGRQFQAVVEEAPRDLLERKRANTPRPEVIAYFKSTIERNQQLYRKLAE